MVVVQRAFVEVVQGEFVEVVVEVWMTLFDVVLRLSCRKNL